jgi:hypothetical protein
MTEQPVTESVAARQMPEGVPWGSFIPDVWGPEPVQVPADFSEVEAPHDGIGTLDAPPPGITVTVPVVMTTLGGDDDPDDPPVDLRNVPVMALPAATPDRQLWLLELQTLVASAATYDDFKTAVAALTAGGTP